MGPRTSESALDGSRVRVPAFVGLRATISGPVPGVRGLSYRLSANWVGIERGPYIVNPPAGSSVVGFGAAQPLAVPVDTFRTTIGLQYDFGP
jgi:hypothetical protein